MADHIRKQVRDAVASAVTGLATTGNRIFRGRAYAMSERYMPALVVLSTQERVTPTDPAIAQPRERLLERIFTVQLVAVVSESEEEIVQDRLDQILLEVDQALYDDPSLGGLADETLITGSRMPPPQEGESGTIGQLEIIVDVTAYTIEGAADAPLTQNE